MWTHMHMCSRACCVCVVLVLFLYIYIYIYIIYAYYFKGMYECVFVFYSVVLQCYIKVLYYVRHLECIWILTIQISVEFNRHSYENRPFRHRTDESRGQFWKRKKTQSGGGASVRRAWIMCVPCFSVARPTKFDKVVRREICQVSTQGIRSFSQRDGDVGDAQPSYLLAICEVSGVWGQNDWGVW